MSLTLLDTILDAHSLPREAQELPKAAKMEPKSWKKECLKTSCFQTRFLDDVGFVFNGFLDDFLKPKIAQIAKTQFFQKPEKYWFYLGQIDIQTLCALRLANLADWRLGETKFKPKSSQNWAGRLYGSPRWTQNALRKPKLAARRRKWRPIRSQCGHLGASWVDLGGVGESWRFPGSLFGTFLEHFLPSWAICEKSKKPRKTNGFHRFFRFQESSGARKIQQKSIEMR